MIYRIWNSSYPEFGWHIGHTIEPLGKDELPDHPICGEWKRMRAHYQATAISADIDGFVRSQDPIGYCTHCVGVLKIALGMTNART